MIIVHDQVAPGGPRVCLCVKVIKKTSDICLFRAGGQQTQVGLYQTEMCLFLKVICISQMKVFLWQLGEI